MKSFNIEPLRIWSSSVVSPFETSQDFNKAANAEFLGRARIDGFDPKTELTSRSVRNLDRSTALLLTSVQRLDKTRLDDVDDPNEIGVIAGTSFGSVSSTIQFTQEGLAGDRPYLVNPAKFPNTVMNFAAAQVAIWNGFKGPNATVIAGVSSLFSAMNYGRRLLRTGQASALVVGASEEWSTERCTIEQSAGGAQSVVEGAASFVIDLKESHHTERRPIVELSTFHSYLCISQNAVDQAAEHWSAALHELLCGRRLERVMLLGDVELAERCWNGMARLSPSPKSSSLRATSVAVLDTSATTFGAWSGGFALEALLGELKAEQSALLIAADPLHRIASCIVVNAV